MATDRQLDTWNREAAAHPGESWITKWSSVSYQLYGTTEPSQLTEVQFNVVQKEFDRRESVAADFARFSIKLADWDQ